VARFDKWRRACRAHGTDEFDGEFILHIDHIEQDALCPS